MRARALLVAVALSPALARAEAAPAAPASLLDESSGRTTTLSVDVASMSVQEVPARDAQASTVIASDATPEPLIKVTKAQRRPGDRASTVQATVGGHTQLVAVAIGANQPLAFSRSVQCDSVERNGTNGQPLRFEHITLGSGDEATLTLGEGWFDAGRCQAMVHRRTTIKLSVLGRSKGQPLLFGYRTRDALVVVPASFHGVFADALNNPRGAGFAPIHRVSLPLTRGAASELLVDTTGAAVAGWLARARGTTAPPEPPTTPRYILRVEASQLSGEDAPTVIVSGRVDKPPPAVAFAAAPSPTKIRHPRPTLLITDF